MKRFLNNFLAISGVALLMLTSCKKSDTLVVTNGGTPGALTASATTLPLDKNKVSDPTTVVTFNFTAPKYTYKAAVTNTIQFDSVGDNWKKPQSVTMPLNVLTQSFNTADFNTILLKLVPAGVASNINVRVQHSLSSTENTYSNVVQMTVTAFNLNAWLYVVGSFQGWNLGAVDSLESVTGNGVYTGIINFPAGDRDFLILPQKTNYNNKWATSDPINTTSSTATVGAANNFYAPAAAGNYIVTLNTNSGTIAFAASDYYSVIGDAALGWAATGNDTEMKFINDGSNNWAVTLPLVSTGSFKIRQDDAWTNSWGTPKAGTPGDGIANTLNSVNNSNNNITIATSGTYKVTFVNPPSILGGTTIPLVTTTYTATKQ
jgi:hypothetical protein